MATPLNDDGGIPGFLRIPQEARNESWRRHAAQLAAVARERSFTAPAPAAPAAAAVPGKPGDDEKAIRAEADLRWRNWHPSKDDTRLARPQLRTFVKEVRQERKVAAREARRAALYGPVVARAREAAKAVFAARPKASPQPAGEQPRRAASGPGKTADAIQLMRRQGGASVAELTAATGWKPHTLRARISGMRKDRDLPLNVTRTATGYQIEDAT